VCLPGLGPISSNEDIKETMTNTMPLLKELKKAEKTKNNCDAEGEHKEMSSTFCHDTGYGAY